MNTSNLVSILVLVQSIGPFCMRMSTCKNVGVGTPLVDSFLNNLSLEKKKETDELMASQTERIPFSLFYRVFWQNDYLILVGRIPKYTSSC